MTQQNKPVSRCMFCNSTTYGLGCPYSPHKKHVHVTDAHKCIYCGSSNLGEGCPYNPYGRAHVRGVEYNMMAKESIHQSMMSGLFLLRLTQPITEMAAYKMGLIDESGRKIKECNTLEEKASLTPLDMHILKIRRLMGNHMVDLFRNNTLLEMTNGQSAFNAERYSKEVKLTSQIDHVVNSLDEILSEGIEKGFSRGHIENLVIESILKRYEDPKD
jgi:hypothetical protein